MKTKRFLTLTAIVGLVMALVPLWGYLVSLLTVQEQPAADRTSPDLEQITGLSEDEAAARRSVVGMPTVTSQRRSRRAEAR